MDLKLTNWSRDPPPYYHKPARQDVSPTQKWLSSTESAANVIPRNLPLIEFPAGDVPSPPPSVPTPKRTEEDRQRVEAILELRVSQMAKYISPEMMESIKESPYYARYKNAVQLRCHQHRSRKANKRQCYKNLNSLIRNVANEIVYREKRIVVDEMADIDDSQPAVLTKAESKAMAWNLKKSFTLQIKQLHKAAKKGQRTAERAGSSSVLASSIERNKIEKDGC